MVVRPARRPVAGARRSAAAVTAVLGLVWNLCALPAYELRSRHRGSVPAPAAVGFCALGFPAGGRRALGAARRAGRCRAARLGALLVDGRLCRQRDGRGCCTSLACGRRAAAVGAGMRLLTYTFVALVVPLAAVTRGQPGARRALWAAALVDLRGLGAASEPVPHGRGSWPVELLGHHASLPLALAILYQDFPFALADLFLKRALTLLALVAARLRRRRDVGVGRPAVARTFAQRDGTSAVLVTLWVGDGAALPDAPAIQRRGSSTPSSSTVPTTCAARAIAATHSGARRYRAAARRRRARLAPALSARVVSWRERPTRASDERRRRRSSRRTGARSGRRRPSRRGYALEVAELTGGRRLLSDDHRAARGDRRRWSAAASTRIRITRERYDRELREQEIGKLATEAELRALRAQINPHFLFNALTTIGYLIQTAPPRALDTLMRLTALLRGVLRSEGELTTLGRELELIEAYLDIERARFEERLRVRIDVPPRCGASRAAAAPAADRRERRQARHRAAAARRRSDRSRRARRCAAGDGRCW